MSTEKICTACGDHHNESGAMCDFCEELQTEIGDANASIEDCE